MFPIKNMSACFEKWKLGDQIILWEACLAKVVDMPTQPPSSLPPYQQYPDIIGGSNVSDRKGRSQPPLHLEVICKM